MKYSARNWSCSILKLQHIKWRCICIHSLVTKLKNCTHIGIFLLMLLKQPVHSCSTFQYLRRKERLHKWMVLSPSEPQNSNHTLIHMILNKAQQWLIIEWHHKFAGHMRVILCSCIMYDLVWWVFGYSCWALLENWGFGTLKKNNHEN